MRGGNFLRRKGGSFSTRKPNSVVVCCFNTARLYLNALYATFAELVSVRKSDLCTRACISKFEISYYSMWRGLFCEIIQFCFYLISFFCPIFLLPFIKLNVCVTRATSVVNRGNYAGV